MVQKYGGSSVADAEGIRRAAKHAAETYRAGHAVVVVVSAMGDTTDDLLDLASLVSPRPDPGSLDFLLTTGELVSTALLAIVLRDLGIRARTFTGASAGLITDDVHGQARLVRVEPRLVEAALARGEIAVVAGFQGRSLHGDEVTSLGRGGSDMTAVALAAALGAGVCEIYTDVDGMYTADPRTVPTARKLDVVAGDQMLELAASGAKILQLRCVEYARRFGIPIRVRSAFSDEFREGDGTLITAGNTHPGRPWRSAMEEPVITEISADGGLAKVTVSGCDGGPGSVAAILQALMDAQSTLDMIVQKPSGSVHGAMDVSFTLQRKDGKKVVGALAARRREIGFRDLQYDDGVAKVSLQGIGLRAAPTVLQTLLKKLAGAGIAADLIALSDVCLDVTVPASEVASALRSIRSAFHVAAFRNGRSLQTARHPAWALPGRDARNPQ